MRRCELMQNPLKGGINHLIPLFRWFEWLISQILLIEKLIYLLKTLTFLIKVTTFMSSVEVSWQKVATFISSVVTFWLNTPTFMS